MLGYKKAIFIDSNKVKYVKPKNNTFEYNKTIYVFRKDRDVEYYITTQSQPLKLEQKNITEWQYYIDSDEFTTVYKNSLLRKLVLSKQDKYLNYIFYISVVIFVLLIILLFMVNRNYNEIHNIIMNNKDVITI